MSRYLWGIAQIVNDPSSELINIVKSRLASQIPENNTRANNISPEVVIKENKSVQVCLSNREEFDKENLKRPIEVQSKVVQANRSRTKQRQSISSQCKTFTNGLRLKSTNTPKISCLDRGTSTSECTSTVLTKTNANTEPIKQKVCDQHRQVLNALQTWTYADNESDKSYTSIKNLWMKIKSNLSKLQITKIEGLPGYYETDTHSIVVVLYKRVNVK
ncbi:unnamed protein product [Leptosia nina]|uniref:Uncharacterized protein n=1 Tax=Leptosia nina TaxID=320188 RepID=A0AAV1J7E3_9NEOP